MTDYQDALVLENLDLVNWVIRTRISIPNRPLLTYDDFYAIGCEAICRAALKYQPDMGAFAPFACRYIYNAIVDHCRAMNYRLERNVEISEDENASLLDMLTCTSVDFDETVTDATAMSALAACKEKYNGVARKGVEAIEMKLKGYEATEIAKHYDSVEWAVIVSLVLCSSSMKWTFGTGAHSIFYGNDHAACPNWSSMRSCTTQAAQKRPTSLAATGW